MNRELYRKRAAIVGAGALGVGFLYPLLLELDYEVELFDLEYGVEDLEAHCVMRPSPDRQFIRGSEHIVLPGQLIQDVSVFPLYHYDLVFTAVPPGNLIRLSPEFCRLTDTIVVCCENVFHPENMLAYTILDAQGRLPLGVEFFPAIAWVSAYRQNRHYLCDEGYLSLDPRLASILPAHPRVWFFEQYEDEYLLKTVLHNGPHAVLAYLGWEAGCTTIPEVHDHYDLEPLWLELRRLYPKQKALIDREQERMADKGFQDPIARVARTPSRKLMPNERLPVLWRMVQSCPEAHDLVNLAIDYAVSYGTQFDPVVALWCQQGGRETFRQTYCGLPR